MINHLAIAEQRRTCDACPTQYEGRLTDGRWFYFRYRCGRATLGLGQDFQSAVEDPDTRGLAHGDSLDGVVYGAELDGLFAELLQEDAPRMQFLPGALALAKLRQMP